MRARLSFLSHQTFNLGREFGCGLRSLGNGFASLFGILFRNGFFPCRNPGSGGGGVPFKSLLREQVGKFALAVF
ncbi:hypothetical protein AA103587_0706 [Gluconobacter kanchanaburiensis NBRC 103587]|nr:hypothetical protein AA103587_0706 [Gluconobacter kanchanaburiensis NBRC 103587]